jgi:hypothetical protein
MSIGSVVEDWPAPAVKYAMMNSSIDKVKASKAEAIIDGNNRGKVTRQNVVQGFAPRSRDASISDQSKPARRARTTAQTNAMLKTTWANMIECRPKGEFESVKNDSKAMARTMSGDHRREQECVANA